MVRFGADGGAPFHNRVKLLKDNSTDIVKILRDLQRIFPVDQDLDFLGFSDSVLVGQ